MSKFGALLSFLGGVAVLVGEYMPDLGSKYYLVPIGAGLALVAAFIVFRSDRI